MIGPPNISFSFLPSFTALLAISFFIGRGIIINIGAKSAHTWALNNSQNVDDPLADEIIELELFQHCHIHVSRFYSRP